MVTVDRRFGELVEQLRTSGEYDNTMVVLTSDNGYHWGNRAGSASSIPTRRPSVFRCTSNGPRISTTPGTDNRLATSLDLTATIFDVTHTLPAKPLDGDSLLLPPTRKEVFVEYFQDAANGTGIPTWALLRGPTWKYVETHMRNKTTGVVTLHKEALHS